MDNLPAPLVVLKYNALSHYNWGNNCNAWNLVDTEELSVKHERMAADTEEELHYHKKAQQFFQVLKGRAIFEVDRVILMVNEGEGIHIEAGRQHKVMNKDVEELEFLVISQPTTKNDRFNII